MSDRPIKKSVCNNIYLNGDDGDDDEWIIINNVDNNYIQKLTFQCQAKYFSNIRKLRSLPEFPMNANMYHLINVFCVN